MKQPDVQINYGTGKDVSEETIADAGAPLTIRWLPGSYLEVPFAPVGRGHATDAPARTRP